MANRTVSVGSPALLSDLPDSVSDALRVVARMEDSGHTTVVVLVDGTPVGVIALTDRLRDHAATTVTDLTRLTGNSPVLLTGDNTHAAHRIAAEVGIDRVEAGLLPADKTTHVASLRDNGHNVLLIGDGVNDAPAMAAAHVGVSMGRGGSDLAMETSDVVLIRDDLAGLANVIGLSRRAHRVVQANLLIAATVITSLIIWDIAGTLPLPLGVAGHEGSTIIVALNGLRILRGSTWSNSANASLN